jgi:hypothetical protein
VLQPVAGTATADRLSRLVEIVGAERGGPAA